MSIECLGGGEIDLWGMSIMKAKLPPTYLPSLPPTYSRASSTRDMGVFLRTSWRVLYDIYEI